MNLRRFLIKTVEDANRFSQNIRNDDQTWFYDSNDQQPDMCISCRPQHPATILRKFHNQKNSKQQHSEPSNKGERCCYAYPTSNNTYCSSLKRINLFKYITSSYGKMIIITKHQIYVLDPKILSGDAK